MNDKQRFPGQGLLRRLEKVFKWGFVVTGTLGILVAFVGLPTLRNARERAEKRKTFENLKTIAGAVEMYNLDYNVSVTQLDLQMLSALEQNGYLKSLPKDAAQFKLDASGCVVKVTHDGKVVNEAVRARIEGGGS